MIIRRWLRAALDPAALIVAARARRADVVAAWAASCRGPGVTVCDTGRGYRGGPGIPRVGADPSDQGEASG